MGKCGKRFSPQVSGQRRYGGSLVGIPRSAKDEYAQSLFYRMDMERRKIIFRRCCSTRESAAAKCGGPVCWLRNVFCCRMLGFRSVGVEISLFSARLLSLWIFCVLWSFVTASLGRKEEKALGARFSTFVCLMFFPRVFTVRGTPSVECSWEDRSIPAAF